MNYLPSGLYVDFIPRLLNHNKRIG